MELEIIDFDTFPPDSAPDRKVQLRRHAEAGRPARELTRRRQEAMFFPEAEEIC